MSNLLNNTAAMTAITKAWTDKLSGEDKSAKAFAIQMDIVKQHMRWTDAVSPTANNAASGKSTASKESYAELKACFGAVLKKKGRAHDSQAIGSEVKDLKNQLMKRQDPALFAETGGDLSKVWADPKADKTPIETRDQLFKNLKSWAEKNKDALGLDYTPTHRAILTAMETLQVKI
tara:strand:- start:128 stop:655 length:528 start_codon:yes stop_codon:yes gene_type:complete